MLVYGGKIHTFILVYVIDFIFWSGLKYEPAGSDRFNKLFNWNRIAFILFITLNR